MDPNMTLEYMRADIRVMQEHRRKAADIEAEEVGENEHTEGDAVHHHQMADDYARAAADHAAELDEWMSKGGFLPDGWKVGR